MESRQLNYFIQVADCGSYLKKQDKAFISQPALSKTIKTWKKKVVLVSLHGTREGKILPMLARHSMIKQYRKNMKR